MSDANFNREEILGEAARTYAFDKVLRGYDTKQVDDYINNLVKTNKNANELSWHANLWRVFSHKYKTPDTAEYIGASHE